MAHHCTRMSSCRHLHYTKPSFFADHCTHIPLAKAARKVLSDQKPLHQRCACTLHLRSWLGGTPDLVVANPMLESISCKSTFHPRLWSWGQICQSDADDEANCNDPAPFIMMVPVYDWTILALADASCSFALNPCVWLQSDGHTGLDLSLDNQLHPYSALICAQMMINIIPVWTQPKAGWACLKRTLMCTKQSFIPFPSECQYI